MKQTIKNLNINRLLSNKFYKTNNEIFKYSKKVFLSEIENGKGENILDIGCGTGLMSKELKKRNYNIYGADISEEALKKYNKIGNGEIADFEKKFPFKSSFFNNIFASEVIEHIHNVENFLYELKRICKKNGKIYISTPNSNFWVYRVYSFFGKCLPEVQHPGHINFFSNNILKSLFKKYNFVITNKLSNYVFLILPDFNNYIYRNILLKLNFKREMRYKTKQFYWHLSIKRKNINNFWSETLMYQLENNN